MPSLHINGVEHAIDAPADMPLLWFLRDIAGLKGTKFGCGVAQCGACTVLVNGAAQRSCVLPVSALAGQSVTTIEGLNGPVGDAVRSAWQELEVPQCGYCQSGQIMAATDLLQRMPRANDAQIAEQMSPLICRCCTYQRIRRAVRRAADALA